MKRYISAAIKNYEEVDPYELSRYARDPLTPERELRQICNYVEANADTIKSTTRLMILSNMLTNPNVPKDLLNAYVDGQNFGCGRTTFWGAIASNPSITPEIAQTIASMGCMRDLTILAENPNTPADILGQFTESSNYELSEVAASNPNCPPESRMKFEEDNNVSTAYSIYVTGFDEYSQDFDQFLLDVESCVRNTMIDAGYEYLGWDEDPGAVKQSGRFTAYCNWIPAFDARYVLADKIQDDLEAAVCPVDEVCVEVEHWRDW